MKKLKIILIIIVLGLVFALGVLFATNNPDVVTVNYFFGSSTVALYAVVFSAMFIGGLLGIIFGLGYGIRKSVQKHKTDKKIKKMEKEVVHLKASAA